MTIEKFLSFWSHYNTAIIEGLVALIIIFSLFLAFRSFFSKKNQGEVSSDTGRDFDPSQIEKTLQKILESQAKVEKTAPRSAAQEEDLSAPHVELKSDSHEKGPSATAAVGVESPAEVSQLRLSLNETHKKVETLQAQLVEAQAKVAQAAANPAAAGMSTQEKEDFASKIRDLEARLAEYEIISEDIADLSKYRKENEILRNELEAAKSASSGGASTPTAASAPSVVEPVEALSSEPEPTPEPEPVPEAVANPESSNLIDEELMKEFAAAVEGQKAEKAATAAAPVVATEAPKGSDPEKMMDEFENFVAKKS